MPLLWNQDVPNREKLRLLHSNKNEEAGYSGYLASLLTSGNSTLTGNRLSEPDMPDEAKLQVGHFFCYNQDGDVP